MTTTCPFCGAKSRADWGFQCGSGPAVAKPERSIRCRELEVVCLKTHIGLLTNAGDAMAADDATQNHLVEDWVEAKEAKP